ncbi:MAG: protein-glutamate O-methyltransferase CheR [Sulfuricurvum sp.]|nr:protein-glutamate O-methyltransferase CheR [Sulfuricurvum sp.]
MFGWFKSAQTEVTQERCKTVREDFTQPQKVVEMFTALTGIYFDQKEPAITNKLIHFCRNHTIISFEELHTRLNDEAVLLEELINYLTVNETYFFRERDQINYCAQKAALNNTEIRLLCAPGSTGEEPYSIAIALLEAGVPAHRIKIVALDINTEAIYQAKRATYSHRSLHKMDDSLKTRYFTKKDNLMHLRDEVKRLVTFEMCNIFDDQLFTLGVFDTIFSRNMLIYFDQETANKAIERMGKLAHSNQSRFFFGHADILATPSFMNEHYEHGVKFYTL